jgi:hypothetical protein
MLRTVLLLGVAALVGQNIWAQNSPHWGVQGDYFTGAIPRAIVEKIEDLPEQPDIDAKSYNTGLVRFHANGSPSWALEFSRTQMTLAGGLATGPVRQELRANATMRGAMITKYLNFLSRRFISAGLAFGGGAAQLDASYYRYQVPPGPSVIIEQDTVQHAVPIFQAIAQVDIRPVRWISLSPSYGLRNGALGAGMAIRIHFTR